MAVGTPGAGEGPRLRAQEELSELQHVLQQHIAAQIRREEKERREAWHEWWPGTWHAGWGGMPLAAGRRLRPPDRILSSAGRHRDGERPGDGHVAVQGLGPHEPQICGGLRAVPGGPHGQVWAPPAETPHGGLSADRGAPTQAPTSRVVPLLRWGWMAGACNTCGRRRRALSIGLPSCCSWWRMWASGRGY